MKQLLVFLFLLCSVSVFAQDVIVKKDGSTIVCRVVELTSSEIVYKKWSDLNGSNYVMNRADASAVNYQDGKKVKLSEATNLYTPNNQNNGIRQYNDKALLQLDATIGNPYKKVEKLRMIGWLGGIAMVGAGVACYFVYTGSKQSKTKDDYWYEKDWALPASVFLIGGGAACTTLFLIKANKVKKMIDRDITSFPVIQYDFKLSESSSLVTGIDLLKDNSTQQQTLGFGLRYNF